MSTGKKLAITGMAALGFWLFATWIADTGPRPAQPSERAAVAKPDNRLAWMNDKRQLNAWHGCRSAIESRLRYDFDWLFGSATTPGKLEGYGTRRVDFANYTITYSGNRLKAQNGFGAWMQMRYGCKWNSRQNTVEVLYIEPA